MMADSHRIWWQLCLLVLVVAAGVYIGISFDKKLSGYIPESKSFPSTFNKQPSGYSGTFELLGKLGLASKVWQLPYRRLPEIKGTLVIISPSESPAGFEIEQILPWVEKGNNLIYLDYFAFKFERRILSKLGVDHIEGQALVNSIIKTDNQTGELTHVPQLTVTADNRLTGGSPLFKDSSGAILTQVKYGQGTVLLGVVPSLCANEMLSNRQYWPNFQFLANWLRTRGGEVWFDEHCHGYNAATNVFTFLARGPCGLVCLQLAIILLVVVGSSWQRFGASNVLDFHRQISNLEFINGLASTYQRARATNLVFEILSHAFKSRLSRALAISPDESNERLSQAWAQATGGCAAELESCLSAASCDSGGHKLSDEELLKLCQACDKISELSCDLFATTRGNLV